MELGNGVYDGLNKFVLFYANKIVLFYNSKIETPVKPKNSRQNGRKGMVLVQSERNEISAESKYGSAL